MPWSIASKRVNYFQSKTALTPESRAALKAHRDQWELRIIEEARENGNQIVSAFCGALSGYGIAQPDFELNITIKSAPRDMPNIISFQDGYLVQKDVRDVIEAHDPGVHGFWPVTLHWRNGTAVEQPYWMLNIGCRQETICDDSTAVSNIKNAKGAVFQKLCKFETTAYPGIGDKEAAIRKNPLPVVLDPGKIGKAALWTEAFFRYKAPVTNIISDALYDDLKEVGMACLAPECYFTAG